MSDARLRIMGAVLAAAPTLAGLGAAQAEDSASQPLRFAACADAHWDLVPDADARLRAFTSAAEDFGASFVVQLGDFATPRPGNEAALEALATFPGPVRHVFGNHEVDFGFDWPDVVEFYRAGARYRHFDHGGVRFLILDGNEANPDGGPGGYPRHVGEAQLAWLEAQLAESPWPLILLSHQGPTPDFGLDNGHVVRELLRGAEPGRVLAWLHGHDHLDRARYLDGIPVLSVNSLSYYWVGSDHEHDAGASADGRSYDRRTCAYGDPVFALLELDLEGAEMRVSGRSSAWVGPSPVELGRELQAGEVGVRPAVLDRRLALPGPELRRYRSVDVRGWIVSVEEALDAEAGLRDEVLTLLDAKLREVTSRLPVSAVQRLREVPLWMHLTREGCPGGSYHPSADWLRDHDLDPRWAGGIEFGNARNFLTWVHDQPSMVLHELAHAWHHQVLGYGHEGIRRSWESAERSGRYDSVTYVRGGRKRHYALNNPQELFAELSEAWWGTNDFFPFVRGELLEHDAAAAETIREAWHVVPP